MASNKETSWHPGTHLAVHSAHGPPAHVLPAPQRIGAGLEAPQDDPLEQHGEDLGEGEEKAGAIGEAGNWKCTRFLAAQPQHAPKPTPSPHPSRSLPHHEPKVEEEHDGRHEHQHGAQQELGVRVEGEERKGGGQRDGKLQQVADDEAHQLQQAAEPDGEGLRQVGWGGVGREDVSVEGSTTKRLNSSTRQQGGGAHTCRWWAAEPARQQQAWQQACTCVALATHSAVTPAIRTLPFTTPPCRPP